MSSEEGATGKRTGVSFESDHDKKRKIDAQTSTFTRVLTGEAVGAQGLLRARRLSVRGEPGGVNIPFPHQQECCKKMMQSGRKHTLVVHDPGMGKTFTYWLFLATKQMRCRGKAQKTLVSVPFACLEQWYVELVNTIHVAPVRVLKTNKLDKITRSSLAAHDVFIVSRELVARAFASSFRWVKRHSQNERGSWVSRYDRIPGSELHPLLTAKFSIFGIDEAHFMRNAKTLWTQGHQCVSTNSESVIAMTATPIFNKPDDMLGIATAMDLPPDWRSPGKWFTDRQRRHVNLNAIAEFNRLFTDHATDDVLRLPPIVDTIVDFDAALDPKDVLDYNDTLFRARKLHFTMLRRGTANMTEQTKLIAYLHHMQQMLVSPLLAAEGATAAKKDPSVSQRAAQRGSGSLVALREQLVSLGCKGYARVMVASMHVCMLHVAKHYVETTCPEVGKVIVYEGSMTQKRRSEAVHAFLNESRTVLLMSIDAGGTGLHLVPGSNAIVFWGSRPFSPMQVFQTKKRIHRIGQELPVTVIHLIAHGSVDYAIEQMHKDKLALARAVVNEVCAHTSSCKSALERCAGASLTSAVCCSSLVNQETADLANCGGRWRTAGRICDSCKFLNENGTFPREHLTERELELQLLRAQVAREAADAHNAIGAATPLGKTTLQESTFLLTPHTYAAAP